MKRIIALIIVCVAAGCQAAQAQGVLTLDECRSRALQNNKSLRQAAEKKASAEAMEKAALWQMLPKVSANGAFVYMDKDVKLVSDEQAAEMRTMGTRVQQQIDGQIEGRFNDIPLIGPAISDGLEQALANTGLEGALNNAGNEISNALQPDVHSLTGGALTVTQPVFMGGKLVALHRTAQLLNHLSGIEYDNETEQTLIAVDEAYWQLVSVTHKQQLAEQYADLLQTLNDNVEAMVKAEVATQSDLTKVRVKLNEAQMNLTKANNGLALSRMLLAQRCGMPLDTLFSVTPMADDSASLTLVRRDDSPAMDSVMAHRREMQMLRISDSIALQGVRVARSGLLPNVAVTGGYLVSNPNIFDGLKKEWGGTLMAGVVVNVPIAHPGAMYSLKAAKHKRREIAYQIEEAQEMIELQVTKLRYELELAYKKLAQAESNMANAEENLKLADESFKAGMIGSSDLMAAQTAWMSAQGDVIDARIEIEMDKVYLRQAEGKDSYEL